MTFQDESSFLPGPWRSGPYQVCRERFDPGLWLHSVLMIVFLTHDISQVNTSLRHRMCSPGVGVARGRVQESSLVLCFPFWGRVFRWTYCSLFCLTALTSRAPGFDCFCLLLWDQRCLPTHPAFYMSAGKADSGAGVYAASALPTEPSPQPHITLFYFLSHT